MIKIKFKKLLPILAVLICLAAILINKNYLKILDIIDKHYNKPPFAVDYSKADKNNNGKADPLDIVSGARKDVDNKTPYKSNYYDGGYPPESEGVCTDVIWRAFKELEIDLKKLIDEDITSNISLYKRVQGKPDPNIDFRRVPNQDVFFKRHCQSLTTELNKDDVENLKQWQPGDIVVFTEKYEHVAIISDKRDRNGVPYVLHNSTPHASEVKLSWFNCPIHAHYRWKYD